MYFLKIIKYFHINNNLDNKYFILLQFNYYKRANLVNTNSFSCDKFNKSKIII